MKQDTFGTYLIIRIELDQDLFILGVDLENRLDRYHGGNVSELVSGNLSWNYSCVYRRLKSH